jgi:hypothetical protein
MTKPLGRRSLRVIRVVLVAAAVLALPASATADDPPAPEQVVTVDAKVQGHGAEWWRRRAVQARRDANKRAATIVRLKRTLAYSPTVAEALALASVVYRVPLSTLRRRAFCESRFDARASNGEAFGLLQFLPSTWRAVPFARFSIWSPYANALAAGWMMSAPVGRGGEWSCR